MVTGETIMLITKIFVALLFSAVLATSRNPTKTEKE